MNLCFTRFAALSAIALLSLPGFAETPKVRAASDPSRNHALVFEPENTAPIEGFLFTSAEISFQVRNTGKKPVRILDVVPRKGAGGGRATPALLQPGAEGKLVLTRQVTELGIKPVAFRVKTDDPAEADYWLEARLFGVSAYTPDLPFIDFQVARAGKALKKLVNITSYESRQFDIKAVLEAPPWVAVKVVPRVAGESSQDLVIEATLLDSAPKGLLRGSVHLLTSVPAQPDLVLPVQARVFDSVSVSPMPATLKAAKIGESRDLVVEFHSLDGRSLKLAGISDSTKALKLTPLPCDAGCVKVNAHFQTSRVGEFGGVISARFHEHDAPVDVNWDILVVAKETKLIDLGVLDDGVQETSENTGDGKGGHP